jgi:fumarylacetoacetase
LNSSIAQNNKPSRKQPSFMATCFVNIPTFSDFSVENLPYGVFSYQDRKHHIGVAIGDNILDLYALAELGYLSALGIEKIAFLQPTLNAIMQSGKSNWKQLRQRLQQLLTVNSELHQHKAHAEQVLVPQNEATMHVPVAIGNYTDFYSSIEHATNVGKLFRPDNPLLPNWKHIPIAYHGRASSIVISGTPIKRPKGQIKLADSPSPIFAPTQMLDFELELGCFIGKNSTLGKPIAKKEVEDYIFGFVLFNDWSARDIQAWEYQPLGPFLSKNFASTISPWVVTAEALAPFRTVPPLQEPIPLPYLQTNGKTAYDITLQVSLQTKKSEKVVICETNYKKMYWTIFQQILHHSSSGCNLQIGDLLASGTISGNTPQEQGCLLEITKRGQIPITINAKEQRTFLEKGDKVELYGFCQKGKLRIGFGKATGVIL